MRKGKRRVIERKVDLNCLLLYELINYFVMLGCGIPHDVSDQLDVLMNVLSHYAGYDEFDIDCDIIDEKTFRCFFVNEFVESEDEN